MSNLPVVVIDNFFPDFDRVRNHAILSEFYDWKNDLDGEVYKRVSMLHIPDMLDTLTKNLGGIRIWLSGYRLNYAGENPNQSIHADTGFGTHVAVVYLNGGDSGTAFWRHKETSATEFEFGQLDLFYQIRDDFENVNAWEQEMLVEAVPNRAVIYKSSLFHSRFPFDAFGSTPEDGRLIAVAFFSFLEEG